MSSPAAPFDRLAAGYDRAWTNTAVGRLQREAVWGRMAGLFKAGDRVLDLGCGTGEDALYLESRGVKILATDSSPEMVRIASQRGVNARVLRIEDIASLEGSFDGILSDFGALNCVEHIGALKNALARLVRPGGRLILCVFGRFCLWEIIHYSARGRLGKAMRRWRGRARSSMGVPVYYPTARGIRAALSPAFELASSAGIGICVPPSYADYISGGCLRVLGRIDARIGSWRFFRALADHRLLIFVRS